MSVRIAKRATSTAPSMTKGSLSRDEAVEDRRAQGQCADRRADRRGADGDRDRDPDPGQDHRRGQRQLDRAQPLPGRQAHAVGRFAHRLRHPLQPGDRVFDDRQQAVEKQRDDCRPARQSRSAAPLSPAPRPAERSVRSRRADRPWCEVAPGRAGDEDRERQRRQSPRRGSRSRPAQMRQEQLEKAGAVVDRPARPRETPNGKAAAAPPSAAAVRQTAARPREAGSPALRAAHPPHRTRSDKVMTPSARPSASATGRRSVWRAVIADSASRSEVSGADGSPSRVAVARPTGAAGRRPCAPRELETETLTPDEIADEIVRRMFEQIERGRRAGRSGRRP